ncbi:MAG TPA: aldehyde dehydrogenase family protein [Dehalococcoidia bacterium]|nr:aldehyde dehydrogenase family protein [Dehalococcoidia bacterium]
MTQTTEAQTAVQGPTKFLINGEWVAPASGKYYDDVSPSTGDVIAQVAEGSAEDVDRAVKAARAAFEGPWAKVHPADRGRMLIKMADLLRANTEELARIDAIDAGKPVTNSMRVDIPAAIDCFDYYAGWADKLHGETVPVRAPAFTYLQRIPVGVVGQIIPWNFPIMMAAWKLAPALACGNTVILKPAEQSPLSALKLGQLCLEAGFPPGVVNIVTGFGETGAALVEHPDVDKIAFTGSPEVGRIIVRASAGTLKKVSLELGGKSPNVILADADLDAAVRGASAGVFFNQGEVCSAGSRILVEKSVYEKFLEAFSQRANTMKVGDPLDPDTYMGPVVNDEQFDRVMSYIDIGKSEGAKLMAGGDRIGDRGYFVQPTIFADVDNRMRIAQEEIFGPVASVIPVDDVDDAVRIANDSMYGLAAAVWTRDVSRAHDVANRLKAGTVWVNTYGATDTRSPWGGFKDSGFGRELGRQALDLYTEYKSVWIHLK